MRPFREPNVVTTEGGKMLSAHPGSKGIQISSTPAVEVENFQEHYNFGVTRRHRRGLDLSIPRGVIYGLVGKDRSGIITLIKYIIGTRHCPNKTVRVLGEVPGTAGASVPGSGVGCVAPARLGLTVFERLRFAGKLYGMSEPQIKERIEYLSESLSLTEKPVGEVSGRTRHSTNDDNNGKAFLREVAAATIHSPRLLILRDPFPSKNPVLREIMWDYLRKLVDEEGVTVLYTCSDIYDIQNRCDIVGIMRSGRLVAQGSPQQLLDDFKCDTLEEVFLHLSLAKNKKPVVLQKPMSRDLIAGSRVGAHDQDHEKLPRGGVEWKCDTAQTIGLGSLLRTVKQFRWVSSFLRRVLMLSKLNLILLRGGDTSFPKFLILLFMFYYQIGGFPHVCSEVKSSRNHTLTDSVINSEGIPGIEFLLCGFYLSLVFGTNLLTVILGRKIRDNSRIVYMIAGMKPSEIITSSLLAQCCVMLLQMVFLSPHLFFAFNRRPGKCISGGQIALGAFLWLLQAFQAVALGILATLPCFSDYTSYCISFILFYANTVLSGTLVPLPDNEYNLWRIISFAMPQTYAAESQRSLIYGPCGIVQNEAWIGILACTGWSALIASILFIVTRNSFRAHTR